MLPIASDAHLVAIIPSFNWFAVKSALKSLIAVTGLLSEIILVTGSGCVADLAPYTSNYQMDTALRGATVACTLTYLPVADITSTLS